MPRKVRRKSVRGYRRTLDELIEMAKRGLIPWCDVSAASTSIKTATEMLMTENLLKSQGVIDMEYGEHPLGEDGGVEYHPNRRAPRFTKKRVTVKRGVDKRGARVDETTVVLDDVDPGTETPNIDDEGK